MDNYETYGAVENNYESHGYMHGNMETYQRHVGYSNYRDYQINPSMAPSITSAPPSTLRRGPSIHGGGPQTGANQSTSMQPVNHMPQSGYNELDSTLQYTQFQHTSQPASNGYLLQAHQPSPNWYAGITGVNQLQGVVPGHGPLPPSSGPGLPMQSSASTGTYNPYKLHQPSGYLDRRPSYDDQRHRCQRYGTYSTGPMRGPPPRAVFSQEDNLTNPGSNLASDGSVRWRDPDLNEVIEFLSHHNPVLRANAAAHLQHLCFSDDNMKQKARALGAIPPLINLITQDSLEIQRNACGASRNLSYASGPAAYSTLGTPAGLSSSAYPTPPSSVNQQLPTQNAAQDDSMRHFHVNSQNNGTSYPTTNFNTSPYPQPKVSAGGNTLPPSSGSMSSCMVAAAAAAAAASSTNPNTPNAPVNYLQHNLTPTGSGDSDACLSSMSNLTPTISDTISNGNKMNESQLNVNVDHPVITSEPTLNSVFYGTDIEFSNLNYPLVDASAAANYAQQMRIDGTGPKKKKERSKKHKKKEKNKSIDRISMPTNTNTNLNNLALFPYHQTPNSHYHETFSNHMNQNCNTFEQQQSHHHSPASHSSTPVHHQQQQSHHHSPASHPSTPVHQQATIYAKSSSTPYPEPSSSVNQQLQQVPQPQQAPSVSQQTLQQSTGVTSSSLSEASQPSHLQSQPNLMPQSDLVPRVSPSCFDTTTSLSNLQSDLLNGSLSEQLHNAGSRHSNHSNHSVHSNQTNSSCDYPKSLSDNTSQQPMIVHHNPDNSCSVPPPPPQHPSSNLGTTENDNQLDNQISEKFSSIEDDLDFLTAAEECESNSQVNRNEIGTQVGPQIVSSNESHNIPMDQQARQHQHQHHHHQHQHQQQLQHHHQQSQPQHVQQQHLQQTSLSSTSIVSSVQPTLITTTPSVPSTVSSTSLSSCMEQSKSTSTISVCTIDPLLTNTCAISDDQIIKSTSTSSSTTTTTSTNNSSNSKGYQTDFIPTAQQQQQRVPTPMTADIGIDINNVENKMNNEVGGNSAGVGGGLIKKKKKSKESKTKIFCSSKLIQGSTSAPIVNNKKSNSMINIVPVHNDNYNKMSSHVNNKSLLSNVTTTTTCKPIEVTNVRKQSDNMKDHEAKFFKMRPVANTTTITTIHEPGMRLNCKSTKKRKLEETGKEHKSVVDEYEFPDSPTHLLTTKKVKRINLENSKKKVSDKLLTNSNNCSITIDRKVSLKPKMKSNQNFTGNTASTKLNISDKTEIINIVGPPQRSTTGRSPINQQPQLHCNKMKIEEKVMKSAVSLDKKHQQQQFNNINNPNLHSNQPQHHNQRLIKDSSKVPSIIVQEIVTQPSSTLPHHHQQHHHQPSTTKNLTNTINIVSISKKSTTIGSNQSKKESPTRTCVMNNQIPTNTITTIVPIPSNTLNTSIIIANPPNLTTTAITNQQTLTHLPQSISTATPTSSSTSITSTQQPQQQQQHPNQSGSLKNLANPNVLMQSAGTNTPRRRSQDKKALTIREGLMRTGDFVVSLDETESELPMIWRIEGKSLLQRFEPSDQDGQIVYTNTSSYSAWNPTVKQRYTGVDVRIVGCNRTKIVVEKLGLTRNNSNYDKSDPEKGTIGGLNVITNGEITVEKCKPPEDKPTNNFQHQADFEVFIQTLISQALDANFISEIIKENDEYFLSHIQAIDDYCTRKKSRFFTKVKWDAHIVKCVETFSSFNVIPQSQVGDLRCRLCHDKWSTQILHFTGKTYDQVTLETKEPVDIKQTKYAACDECKEKVTLFSNLHHQKFNFFTKCREKVEEMRGGVEDKDSPMILEECLKDTDWMQSLFKQFEEIWQSCDRIR